MRTHRRWDRIWKIASGLIILCFLGGWAFPGLEKNIPLRYTPTKGETLSEVAEKFALPPEQLETLNSAPWGGNGSILLIRKPRNREEAVELLEEARQAESLGGPALGKAASLYSGILEAAGLLGSTSQTEDVSEGIEIPSETVAKALLGWGRINEVEDPKEARLAFERVRTFFPDLEEFRTKAEQELAQLEKDNPSNLLLLPPTALEEFPVHPLLVLDINAARLAKEYPQISLYEVLKGLPDLEDPRVSEFMEGLGGVHAIVTTLLGMVQSIHFGVWLDEALFAENPEKAFDHLKILAIGYLTVPPSEFSQKLDLPSPEGSYHGVEYRKLDRDTYLIFSDNKVYVSDDQTLQQLVDAWQTQKTKTFSNDSSTYQRLRRTVGAGSTLFAFLDLGSFIRGPALERARRLSPEDEDEFMGSLVVSGILGFNSVQGIGLGASFEEGHISTTVALAHQGKGLFYFLQSEPCETKLASFFPPDLDGMIRLNVTCGSLLTLMECLFNPRYLGDAGPVYKAQYKNLMEFISDELHTDFDIATILQEGVGTEAAIGFRIPDGILPIPNLIVALPVGKAGKTLEEVEETLIREAGISFQREEKGDYWYRHGILPGTEPFVVELSYTVLDDTLLVASHPSLLLDAITAHRSGENLLEEPEYREFLDSISTPNNLQIYISSGASAKLAMYGKSVAVQSVIKPEHRVLRQIAQSSLDRILNDPQPSGLGLLFARDRVQCSLRFANTRDWFLAMISMDEGRKRIAEKEDLTDSN